MAERDFQTAIFAGILAITIVFVSSPSAAKAGDEKIDRYLKNNINCQSLGLVKELPVDVYAIDV